MTLIITLPSGHQDVHTHMDQARVNRLITYISGLQERAPLAFVKVSVTPSEEDRA